jgi:N-acetylmuramoyl-L-alanine amidase CwlA
MAMPEIRQHLTSINRTAGRGGKRVEHIIVHYTFGEVTAAGAALANCKYFAREKVGASAHYFIDDGPVIWQSVLDRDTAWSVGSRTGVYRHPGARNANTLSIEVCTKGAFTPAEIANLAWLVKRKMAEHGVPARNVIRHYDVTGKLCPAYYVDEARWKALHSRITAGAPAPEKEKRMDHSITILVRPDKEKALLADLKPVLVKHGVYADIIRYGKGPYRAAINPPKLRTS